MKSTIAIIVLAIIMCKLTSCQKEPFEPNSSITYPNAIILTEACFLPTCETLIVCLPNDRFFFEHKSNYSIDWYKDEVLKRRGYRYDCTGTGVYKAIIKFKNGRQMQELEYEIKIEASI